MTIMAQVRQLASSGKQREGIALVEHAAAAGDPEALLILANWRLWGLYGPRDSALTLDLLRRAMAKGSGEATHLLATLTGNGTGGDSDPHLARSLLESIAASDPDAARQLEMLDRMPDTTSFDQEHLSVDPDVRMARNFLTAAECAYLIDKAGPLLRPSTIIDQATGRPRPPPVRTSSSMNFDPTSEDLVVHAINRRIAALTATDLAAGEPLHILRYTPGQEFRPHFDAIAGAENQRQWTALIYLNKDFEGGETNFPELGITTLGRSGDCLVFRACGDDGATDRRLRHAGLPVTSGVKWLASRWIRQRAYAAEILR